MAGMYNDAHLGNIMASYFVILTFEGRPVPDFVWSTVAAPFAGWEPYNLHDLMQVHVSWVGSALCGSCTTSHIGR